MTSCTISTYDRGRRDFSEDAFAVTSIGAVVIDGASGLGDVNESGWASDPQWFAHHTAIGTISHLHSAPTVADAMARALADVAAVAPKSLTDGTFRPEFQPAAAGAAFRVKRGRAEVHVVADVTAVVVHDGGTDVLCDTVLPQIEAKMVVAARQIAAELGISFREALAYIDDLKLHKRSLVNTDDGYPVLSLDGAGVKNGITRSYPIDTVREVLLMSDGFAAAVDCAHLFDSFDHMLVAVRRFGLAQIADKLIAAYAADPDFDVHPRFKEIDDATAVHIRF